MTFVSGRQRTEPTQQTVQSLLDENSQLIQAIVDYQNKGKAYECTQYQQLLHRNLVYLATLADSTQSMQNTIPAPGVQGSSTMKTPPVSVTPPTGSGMLQPGVPDMTPNSSSSTDMMSNAPVMNSGMPSGMNDPMKSNMPSQLGGMTGPTSAGYGASSVSGMGQSTSSPPQLQHPPMTVQSHMSGYPNPPQTQPGRPIAPPPMSASMGNLPPQVPIQSHAPPMGQHMLSQNQQQSQQYMMQQRQLSYRQGAPQQMPQQQQQSLSHSHPGYGPPTTVGMPSGNMMPGYPQQPQQPQRYNPYRPPPQQQGLSHMPYPAQQQPSPMQGQSVMGQPSPMGQAPVGQSPMQQPPLV